MSNPEKRDKKGEHTKNVHNLGVPEKLLLSSRTVISDDPATPNFKLFRQNSPPPPPPSFQFLHESSSQKKLYFSVRKEIEVVVISIRFNRA
jgi:hypothetical protein